MFIATSVYQVVSLLTEAKRGGTTLTSEKRLRSYGALRVKKEAQAINTSLLWSEN